MLQAQAGFVLMWFVLSISGVQGRVNRICAFKGSSVDLLCSAERPTSSMKWFKVQGAEVKIVQTELFADGNHIKYNMSKESNFTLTIKDVSESDSGSYCCGETYRSELCFSNGTDLSVTDLQVKVIPSTEGQTVTLMCSTSCPLTENPALYVWYKNGRFLYEDWSNWYQELVSSDKTVTYSCAIKGYKDLRAPEVSVDSVTSTCFNVTYAKGGMCSHEQTSKQKSCSITYPTEINVQRDTAVKDHVRLTCDTSCPLTDIVWYQNEYFKNNNEKKNHQVPTTNSDSFSCAVKGFKDLHSASVCVEGKNCWSVNYVSRRICALRGSSVNISTEYSHPHGQKPSSKLWYKIERSGTEDAERLIDEARHVQFHDTGNNQHILTINNLKIKDSAEYRFRLQRRDEGRKQPDLPGVTLVVTDLRVKFVPSAEVTEGQRVTLICRTSCPLTDKTAYIWYLNSRPLNLPGVQNKYLLLDPVSRKDAGTYSCAIKTPHNLSSQEKTLTVCCEKGQQTYVAVGVCVVLFILITLALIWWKRRRRTSRQSPRTETSDNLEQLNSSPVYAEISDQQTEQNDLHYSKVHFPQNNATDALYSTVSPHQLDEQEHVTYAIVNLRPKVAPE